VLVQRGEKRQVVAIRQDSIFARLSPVRRFSHRAQDHSLAHFNREPPASNFGPGVNWKATGNG
jgi:hypothetical protein